MDIPEFQSTYTAQTTIMRAKYLHCSEKLSICMGCHHGYGVIKVWRMLKSRDLFSHILCVGLVVVVLLWGRVSTTRELSVCGEMCIQGVLRLCLYHDLFNHLESQYLLDPDNEVHIFCLHHVYVPRINRHLEEPATPCPLTEAELSEFVKQIPPLETIVCIMQLICMRELQNLGINTKKCNNNIYT